MYRFITQGIFQSSRTQIDAMGGLLTTLHAPWVIEPLQIE
jgi:hypothetical protein